MGRKVKYDLAFKIDCVNSVLENHLSIGSVAREKGVNETSIKMWLKFYLHYGVTGLLPKNNSRYSISFKRKVLKEIEDRNLNLAEACLRFNITAKSVILKWRRDYEKSGILGLENKPRGRPPTMDIKRKKRKSAKPLTREEELLKELEYLRAENAVLKKLDALILARKKPKS